MADMVNIEGKRSQTLNLVYAKVIVRDCTPANCYFLNYCVEMINDNEVDTILMM